MNYVGKPLAYILATPERDDDADNPLRVAFGNEANDKDIAAFGRRFAVQVEDGFGSTENAVIIIREEGTPKGSIGKGIEGIAVYNSDTVTECAVARFDATGALANADEAVGELVNTTGSGFFTGYYNDPEAPTATSLVPSVNVVVVNDADEILMTRRSDNENWAVPGGAIDLGESMTQAAIRETPDSRKLRWR